MDPTSLNRQGNDVGTEYRSVAFYRNEKEKKIIENEIARINASGKYTGRGCDWRSGHSRHFILRAIPSGIYFNHPGNPYVQRVSIPDYLHFRKTFKAGRFKD